MPQYIYIKQVKINKKPTRFYKWQGRLVTFASAKASS